MPKKCGQHRHPPVDVLVGVEPVEDGVHGQRMPEIVWARSGARAAAVQADLADQLDERAVEFLAAHAATARTDEERRRRWRREARVAQPRIVAQRPDRGLVQRYLAL